MVNGPFASSSWNCIAVLSPVKRRHDGLRAINFNAETSGTFVKIYKTEQYRARGKELGILLSN